MPDNNIYKGERLSFYKIFSQRKYKIVVPIIQRDYAQGRTNEGVSEVRKEFLDKLYCYLANNLPNRDLDFVYGTIESQNDGKQQFIPLDGQQRLTTLFLLHWYLYQISTNEEKKCVFKENMMSENNRSLFTYETRQSSSEFCDAFCDALVKKKIDMDNLKTVEGVNGAKEPSLSATIEDASWFFRSWKKDPTIQSMLVMLDAIHDKFKGHGEFFERLLDEDKPIITFVFLDLKEYKLSDDLYIKMNSRGKPLTKFENFKAKFIEYIKKIDDTKHDREFFLDTSDRKRISEYFSHNIDTKWTNLLWQYCKKGNPDKLDSYIENLIRVIVTNYYASTEIEFEKNKTTNKVFEVLIGESESLTFNKYESTGVFKDPEAVLAVIDSLDALYNGNQKIQNYISESYKYYFDENDIFQGVIENPKLSRTKRIQFFAYVQYLIQHKVDKDNKYKINGLNEWMRVVHNLTHSDNTSLDSDKDFAKEVRAIKNLLPHAPSIIEYLKTTTIEELKTTTIKAFSDHQIIEERIKAHLVEKDGWKDLVENTEKHPYFNGQIGFILEFSGICDYFPKNNDFFPKNNNWSSEENKIKENFINYSKIAKEIFPLNNNKRFKNKDHCFERAVLSNGPYVVRYSDDSPFYFLLSTDTTDYNIKRDYSWKRLLRMTLNDKDRKLENKKNYVKETFKKITDLENIEESLEKLCISKTGDKWRNVLISTPEMFDKDVFKYGFIYFKNKDIFLITKWELKSFHYELFTYYLWVKKLQKNSDFFEHFKTEYRKQAFTEKRPYISVVKRDDVDCEIRIEAFSNCDNKREIYNFEEFQITYGFKDKTRKGSEFCCYCNSEELVIDTVKELTKKLSE